jgi:hypothetical protein
MYLNKMLLIAMALSLPVTFLPAKQTNAGSVPRTPPILWDCARYNTCTTMLRERVNIFQGLGKSKPAIDYCRAKYGNEATVEWKFGFRWCATPYQI